MPQKNTVKIALVTGASSGIGREICLKLLSNGYTVYAAARRVEKMQDLKNAGAHLIQMDITVEEDVKKTVENILADSGRIDILVNNAGFGSYGAMEDTSLSDARYQFEVNLFGLARLTQLVLPSMRQQKSGKIVNISSMGGKMYTLLGSWYHATKHALEGWSDCLRLELAPLGIQVIIIEPGAIQTDFGKVAIAPMMERSGHSAYAKLAGKAKKMMVNAYEKGGASPPSVIAEAVYTALQAKKPKTRYVAGKYARLMICLRTLLGDRLFDKLVMSM